jgi:iron complex transport system substrate-binding protein
MTRDGARSRTRRDVLKIGGGLAASGLLAGCTGGGNGSGEATDTSTDSTYTVSIEPVGEVEFAEPPETWVANNGSWADMGVALGVEPPLAMWLTSRYHTQYYDEIPGVSVDKSGMVSLYQDGVSKELFYSLDQEHGTDIHVIDPNFLMNRFKGWEQSDIDEVSENIAPFFGNSIFSRGYAWHESYRYYTLYEAFEKLAKVFRRTDRYEAFASLHEEFQSTLSPLVPTSNSERPQVAIMWAAGNQPTSFLPYLIGEGTSFKQWRDLNVRDAFAETEVKDFHSSRGSIDLETLLEIDPEVLLFRGHEHQTAEEFRNTVVAFLKEDDTASALTAVQNGDVYRGGPLYQGPITNLVVTQRAAEQLYGVEEQLYDPERIAPIVNGEV